MYNSRSNNPSMNRNIHSSHSYGGTGGNDGAQGRGGGGHHHHGMNPNNNPNMDSYSSGRSSNRMGLQHNNMGSNGPITPGGGMGSSNYPNQSTQDAGSPVNTSNMGQNMGYGGGPMDNSMNHPSMMGNNNMFDLRSSGGSGMGSFSGSMGSDIESRNLMAAARRSGGRSSSGGGGGGGGTSSSSGGGASGQGGSSGRSGISQAEREEELLLNLLIARRQRGRNASGEPSPALREELMRIRQQGGGVDPSIAGPIGGSGVGSGGGGGSMGGGSGGSTGGPGAGGSNSSMPQQMHGVPPMYDAASGMGSGMMGNSNSNASSAFPPGVSRSERLSNNNLSYPSSAPGYGDPNLLKSDIIPSNLAFILSRMLLISGLTERHII